ncbi:MAG: 23S rRNA (pseudouridine(1915)-N(3))-methyltransferase RlmH, partial [Methyloligellaceae bacterium]
RQARLPMRLTLAAVGRLKAGAERELLTRYTERITPLGRKQGCGPISVIEIGESRQGAAKARCEEEADVLLRKLPAGADIIALDETGRALTSAAFAGLLEGLRDGGTRELAFLIGGPDGHGEKIRAAASRVLSFGPMTLPHGLVRIILVEQIYRALTILDGHPYHRGS